MAAYMRNQFAYLGIKTPVRRKICATFFKEAQKSGAIDWVFIDDCWQSPYRELQYAAVDYLGMLKKQLTPKDIPRLKKLALTKPWWDTIDGLDTVIGQISLSYPKLKETLLKWSEDESFWLRRIAIDHQLTFKKQTDTELLKKIILNNLGQKEFFINKAIGWSLREYSKTDAWWVKDFLAEYEDVLAPLAFKEASKHLKG